jgi:hypothetical protein
MAGRLGAVDRCRTDGRAACDPTGNRRRLGGRRGVAGGARIVAAVMARPQSILMIVRIAASPDRARADIAPLVGT